MNRAATGRLDLHRRHPVTNLAGLAGCVLLALSIPRWWASSALLLVVLAFAATSRAALRPVTVAALPIGALGMLIQLLLGAPVTAAAGLGGRIALFTGGGVLFALTTGPTELLTACGQLRLDPRIGYVLAGTLQLVPRMRYRAQAVVAAQRARGLQVRGGPLARVRVLVAVTGPLLLGVLAENEERVAALTTRGFPGSGRPIPYRALPFRRSDAVATAVVGAAVAAGLVAALRG